MFAGLGLLSIADSLVYFLKRLSDAQKQVFLTTLTGSS
jgi:hypothetical protein